MVTWNRPCEECARGELEANPSGSQSGQAVIEYILLLTIVVGAYVTIASWISQYGLAQKLTRPITQTFARAYQYGDTEALGYDDGGPKRHPRANTGSNENFRMFINPEIR